MISRAPPRREATIRALLPLEGGGQATATGQTPGRDHAGPGALTTHTPRGAEAPDHL